MSIRLLALAGFLIAPFLDAHAADVPATYAGRVAAVTGTPGLVAFWDFVQRESDGDRRFVAHVPAGTATAYPLDVANYVKDYWGQGRAATYADFPLLGRGPFGDAILIRNEPEETFRPYFLVPRARLHDTPLDIKGAGKSVTVVVWAIRESGNHALAGIWHEGTDLKQGTTAGIQRVERGQRQYALFAGLNVTGASTGHVSENGASSFAYRYALHKSNTGDVSPAVPSDAPPAVLDGAWETFAMTFDHERDELAGWLRGRASPRWLENVKTALPPVYNAWLQGELGRMPGFQSGEDANFPADQVYNPPEGEPVAVEVLEESPAHRVEVREYGYTRVKVTLRQGADGAYTEAARDLVAVRLNPWWYPHDLYSPPDAVSGGPFTIGRVIHSARSVGFTGWIGGVAVFDRALSAEEITRLTVLGRAAPIARPAEAARTP